MKYMPYQRPQMTLAAPAIIARQAEQQQAQPGAAQAEQPAKQSDAGAALDVAELAERVYRLMQRDAIAERERQPRF
jgi:hypothetical protein